MKNTLIFSVITRESEKFVSGTYEVEFPTRQLMLKTLAKMVRRGENVQVKG